MTRSELFGRDLAVLELQRPVGLCRLVRRTRMIFRGSYKLQPIREGDFSSGTPLWIWMSRRSPDPGGLNAAKNSSGVQREDSPKNFSRFGADKKKFCISLLVCGVVWFSVTIHLIPVLQLFRSWFVLRLGSLILLLLVASHKGR